MSAPLEETSLEGRRLGRYTLRRRIARGGMGSIYLATIEGAAGFERWLAVKLMHPHLGDDANLVKRFHDEARVASRIQHPNVCSVIDFGEDADGALYLVMEYLHGEPLTALLEHDEPIEPWMALRLVADAARGLDAAHGLTDDEGEPLGLVHRDVSPQNLFVLYEGPTKVLDFGVVRVRDQIASTHEGALRGKLGYMSPEHLESAPLDRRADVFGLGVVLWELLTSQRLYKRDTAGLTVKAILFSTAPSPSSVRGDLDPRLDALVAKALRAEPELRYPTAAAFADAIEELLAELGERSDHARIAERMQARFGPQRQDKESALGAQEVTEAATHVYRPEPSHTHVRARRRRPWLLPLVATLGIGLGITGTFFAMRSPAPSPSPAAQPSPSPSTERAAQPSPSPPTEPEPEPTTEPTPTTEPAPTPDPSESGRATPATPPGRLNLIVLPEADVFLRGRRLGRTPLVGVRVPSGRHRLDLRAPDGRRETITVRVRPGRVTALSHRFGGP